MTSSHVGSPEVTTHRNAAQPILPPATIGMLGGGQLGRYALMAARTMGYRTVVLDPVADAPAGAVADVHLIAAYDDAAALAELAATCDVVTTEFENPPAAALAQLAANVAVAPSPRAVSVAQDRIAEKRFVAGAGIPVGPLAFVETSADLDAVDDAIVDGGAVVKTARLGYDGKGQRRVASRSELHDAWFDLGAVPCVVESLLDLECEVSVLLARTATGDVRLWPVAENEHVDGILDVSIVPAGIDAALERRALELAVETATALDYVGVLAVEMFVVDGELLVNEIAPRPHNSGHWTLDGCVTSQFEQQVRAVCGVGLGSTAMTHGGVAMVNLLGDLWFPDGVDEAVEPDWSEVLHAPDAKLHLYGKSSARPARKMGHLTVVGESARAAARRARELRRLVAPSGVR